MWTRSEKSLYYKTSRCTWSVNGSQRCPIESFSPGKTLRAFERKVSNEVHGDDYTGVNQLYTKTHLNVIIGLPRREVITPKDGRMVVVLESINMSAANKTQNTASHTLVVVVIAELGHAPFHQRH